MQDQGKRLLIAVGLALGVLLAWQMIFPQKDPPKKPATTGSGSGAVVESDDQPKSQVGVSPNAPAAPVTQRGPEKTIKLTFPTFEATFSSYGGVLKSWHLTDKRYDRDKTKGELLPLQPDTGAFDVNFASSTFVLPPHAEWVGSQVSPTEVRYGIITDNLDVEKTFTIVPASYIVKLTVRVKVKVAAGQEARQTLAVTMYGFHDPKDDGGGGQSVAARVWDSSTMRGEEDHLETGVKAIIAKPRFETNFHWTGFEHPYLIVALAPKPELGLTVEKYTFAEGTAGLMKTDVLWKPDAIFKSDSAALVREAVAYLGPKNYNDLDAADAIAGFPTHLKDTMDLGWFAFIGRPLLWLLLKFYSFLGNWGLAIMLLTVLVKGLTIPFTTRSMRSMKAIAVLAPQLKDLQAKYKDDRQRLQMETMALYKQHGANPLSGCLPILLQMPIWLALYRMLSSTGELYQQPFIPGWIDDLTMSDPAHVLPIVLMITMFLQARLQPMGPTTDPSQKLQQRMMQYGLPLMFGVMSFFFPAGLTLYIFTNTCLSAVHSIWMNKFDKKSIALTEKINAAREASLNKAKPAVATSKPLATTKPDGDDEDEADDEPEPAAASASKPAPRNMVDRDRRPKRKKRRR